MRTLYIQTVRQHYKKKHLFPHVRSEDNYTLFPVIDNQPIMNVSASNEVRKHAWISEW